MAAVEDVRVVVQWSPAAEAAAEVVQVVEGGGRAPAGHHRGGPQAGRSGSFAPAGHHRSGSPPPYRARAARPLATPAAGAQRQTRLMRLASDAGGLLLRRTKPWTEC